MYRVIRDVWVFLFFVDSQHLGSSFFVILFRMEEFAPAVLFVDDCTSTKVAKRRNYKSNKTFCSLVHVKNFYYYRKHVFNEYINIYHWHTWNKILFLFSSHRTSNIFFFFVCSSILFPLNCWPPSHQIRSSFHLSVWLSLSLLHSHLLKTHIHYTQS